MKLSVISVDLNLTDLLIRYSAFFRHRRENGSIMGQYISEERSNVQYSQQIWYAHEIG
jgi:hypothetical protein